MLTEGVRETVRSLLNLHANEHTSQEQADARIAKQMSNKERIARAKVTAVGAHTERLLRKPCAERMHAHFRWPSVTAVRWRICTPRPTGCSPSSRCVRELKAMAPWRLATRIRTAVLGSATAKCRSPEAPRGGVGSAVSLCKLSSQYAIVQAGASLLVLTDEDVRQCLSVEQAIQVTSSLGPHLRPSLSLIACLPSRYQLMSRRALNPAMSIEGERCRVPRVALQGGRGACTTPDRRARIRR